MDHASLQSFIKTIFIIVLVYYLFRFAFKFLAPFLLKKAVSKVSENFQKQQQAYQNQNNQQTQQPDFESELKRAFESEADKAHKFELTRTDSRHFALEEPYYWKTVEPRRVTDWTTTADANGNNVDAEYEATVVLKTQMNYRLLAQLQNFEFSQVKLAMRK